MPKDNSAYWTAKVERNKQRDMKITEELTNKRWIVVRIWECDLKYPNIISEILKANTKILNGGEGSDRKSQ